jgi:2-aminoethylphosphonate-pyruvate transaminase
MVVRQPSKFISNFLKRDASFIETNRRVRNEILAIVDAEKTHVCVPMQGSGTFAVEEIGRAHV